MLGAQQKSLIDALLAEHAGASTALSDIRGGTFSPEERLNIYRNNLRENFLKVLELEFPVVQRLVGADYFRQTARQFLQQSPSRSGDLFHCGRAFPHYLRHQFADSDYAYLPDVAALEWSYQEAMIAADDPQVFDLAALARLEQDSYDRLRLQAHPALRLVRSPYPIVAIWAANQPDAPGDATIDIGRGGDNGLVTRALRSTQIAAIGAGAATFLGAVLEQQPLGVALEAALAADPAFDVESALGPWIQARVFVSWSLA
jgi:hypothetical protein